MSSPPPDDARVIEVFEARHYDGLQYREMAEQFGISVGCAVNYYRRGLQLWNQFQRLTPDEEYAGLRVGLEHAATELIKNYNRGQIDVEVFVKMSVKIASEIRMLTGAGMVKELGNGQDIPMTSRAMTAIEEMEARQNGRPIRKAVG